MVYNGIILKMSRNGNKNPKSGYESAFNEIIKLDKPT